MSAQPRWLTQPVCWLCWYRVLHPNDHQQPHTLRDRQTETCCLCGEPTISGIYVRLEAGRALYPSAPAIREVPTS